MVVMSAPQVHINNSKLFTMASLNSRLQLALLNRKKGRNLLEKGFTLVELMIVIVIVGILSSVALPNFLSQSAKAKITEPLGKSSAALKQAQSIWVEKGTFTGVTCADVGITGTGGVENSWTYTCTGEDDTFTVAVDGVADGPNDKLGLSACSIDGPTGVITACTKDTDAGS